MKHLTAVLFALVFAITSVFAQADADKLRQYVSMQDFDNAGKIVAEVAAANKENSEILLMCGEVYEQLDKYDKAAEVYKWADKADRGEWEIYLKIGNAEARTGNYSEASKWYNEALEKISRKDKKNKYRAQLEYADALIMADSLDKAEKIIVSIRSKDKDNPDVYLKLGNLYFAQKIYPLAETNYKKVLEFDENNIQARIDLAVCYYWLGNGTEDKDLRNDYYNRCLDEWKIVSEQDPKNAKAWYMQGKILFFAKKYQRSVEAFENYVKLRPSDIEARWMLGKSHFETGDCDKSRESLEMVIENNAERRDEAYLMIAQCFHENDMHEKAVETYNLISEPLGMKDRRRLGMSYFNSGDSLTAYKIWREAYEEDSSDPNNRNYLRLSAMQMGTMKPKLRTEAVETAELWLSNPEAEDKYKPQMLYLVGQHLIFLDSLDEDTTNRALTRKAIDYLHQSVALDSNYVYSWMYLGDAYAKIDSMEKSVENFYKAVEICKTDSAKYYGLMGSVYAKIVSIFYEDKDWSGLKEHSDNWAEDQPDSEYAWLYLGFANHFATPPNYPAAKAAYRKCLEINGKNKYARDYLNKLNNANADN